jgi:hypothetical protein
MSSCFAAMMLLPMLEFHIESEVFSRPTRPSISARSACGSTFWSRLIAMRSDQSARPAGSGMTSEIFGLGRKSELATRGLRDWWCCWVWWGTRTETMPSMTVAARPKESASGFIVSFKVCVVRGGRGRSFAIGRLNAVTLLRRRHVGRVAVALAVIALIQRPLQRMGMDRLVRI